MNKQKLFITGATGLLGRSILFSLYNEYEITALRREKSILTDLPKNISWVTGDLDNPETFLPELITADIVIHAAAKVNFNPKQADNILNFNIETTKTIVNTCLEHNIRLLHVSSVAAIGSLAEKEITENSPFNLSAKNTDYALSKYFSEIEVWRGIAEGLNAIIVNPSIIIGIPSKFPESSGIFWKQVHNGLPFYPTGSTGFVDARDVAECMKQLLRTQLKGERFIINGVNKSYKEFFSTIANSMEKKPPKFALKKTFSGFLWRASSLLRALGFSAKFSKALHNTIKSQIHYKNDKIKEAIPITFRSFEESITWVSEAYISD